MFLPYTEAVIEDNLTELYNIQSNNIRYLYHAKKL